MNVIASLRGILWLTSGWNGVQSHMSLCDKIISSCQFIEKQSSTPKVFNSLCVQGLCRGGRPHPPRHEPPHHGLTGFIGNPGGAASRGLVVDVGFLGLGPSQWPPIAPEEGAKGTASYFESNFLPFFADAGMRRRKRCFYSYDFHYFFTGASAQFS